MEATTPPLPSSSSSSSPLPPSLFITHTHLLPSPPENALLALAPHRSLIRGGVFVSALCDPQQGWKIWLPPVVLFVTYLPMLIGKMFYRVRLSRYPNMVSTKGAVRSGTRCEAAAEHRRQP